MKRLRGTRIHAFLTTVFLGMTVSSHVLAAQSVNVTTWHNDIGRTGQNTNETVLTTSNVAPATFGKLCTYTLMPNEQVYTQPLVVTGVNIGGQHTVVYVVTQLDNVYAFDGVNVNTDGSCILLLPERTLLLAGESPVDCSHLGGCPSGPYFGILGTPVIDATAAVLYLVAETQTGTFPTLTYYHRLHALKLTDLSEQDSGPVQICQNGCGIQTGSQFSQSHIQRPGLLWLSASQSRRQNNMVYASFSMDDGAASNPNGWIFGYNAANLQDANYPLAYETTPGTQKRRGGIWQGGAGLVAAKDSGPNYYLYFSTGDGDFDLDQPPPVNTDAADAFIKLNTDLSRPSGVYYFAPSDQYWRGCDTPPNFNDMDLGSGGTMALPETAFSPARYYAVKADKENYMWAMDRTLPGGYTGGNSQYQYCGSGNYSCANPCQAPNNNVAEQLPVAPNHYTGAQARSSPAFWSGMVSTGDRGELYFAANGTGPVGQMKRYPVSTSCSTPPICSPVASTNVDPTGTGLGYAATPSVSSNPSYQNGIVWAIKLDSRQTNPALFAFDAGSLTELWDSKQCVDITGVPRDQPGVTTKFSVPTIANGFVYIGTQTDFDIYGMVASRTCSPAQ
jgi:hypothetical protein